MLLVGLALCVQEPTVSDRANRQSDQSAKETPTTIEIIFNVLNICVMHNYAV